MNDEGEIVDPKAVTPDPRYGETLLYDFSKFLTTLSLFALSAGMALTQAADRADVKLVNILAVLGAIALAGVLAVSTASALVEARSAGREPHPRLGTVLKAAMALLGIGTGGFAYMWWDTLL